MTIVNYENYVANKLKKPEDILVSLDPHKANLMHLALGVAGEAGELVDAIKKHCIYNKSFDRNNVIEELGDLEFYLAGLRTAIFASREEIINANMRKLDARYKDKFSDKEASDRNDKAEVISVTIIVTRHNLYAVGEATLRTSGKVFTITDCTDADYVQYKAPLDGYAGTIYLEDILKLKESYFTSSEALVTAIRECHAN